MNISDEFRGVNDRPGLTVPTPTDSLSPMIRATSYGYYYYYATLPGRGWSRTR
jgi:hypothetical protein